MNFSPCFFNIFFIIVATVSAISIGKKIVNSITEPLLEIENATKELSNGNLRAVVKYEAEDEIGSLAHHLRSSISTLRRRLTLTSSLIN